MTTHHPETHIVGPAAWTSYLLNGDASGLTDTERAQADAWLQREGVRIVGLEFGAHPWFCNAARIHGSAMPRASMRPSWVATALKCSTTGPKN